MLAAVFIKVQTFLVEINGTETNQSSEEVNAAAQRIWEIQK